MTTRHLLLVLLGLLATVGHLSAMSETDPGARMVALYKQCKVSEARAALHALVRPLLKGGSDVAELDKLEAASYLGSPAVAAYRVSLALQYEEKFLATDPLDDATLLLVRETADRLAEVQAHIEKSPFKDTDRVQGSLRYAIAQRKTLLVRALALYRDLGRPDLRAALIADNRAFLAAHGIATD